MFNLNRSDGKETKQVVKHTANDVDQVKRSSSSNLIGIDYGASRHFRKPIAGKHPQLALPTGSVNQP
jgi:hypothetical protein